MKELQKINDNSKAKTHQTNPRYNLEQEMKTALNNLLTHTAEQELTTAQIITGDPQTGARQKLKTFKKILESKEEKDQTAKKLIRQFLLQLHLKEYIFGDIELKPALLNLLRAFHKIQPISIPTVTSILQELPLQQFSEIRYTLELLDTFAKTAELSKEEILNLAPITSSLMAQFQNCYKIIFGDGFKYKWLEHFVDVLRAVNNHAKLFKQHLNNQLKERLLTISRQITTQFKLLTKQVLTQLYLLIVYLEPQEKPPKEGSGPCLIHYLHSKNVILGQNIIHPLLEIAHNLKQTQYKCQLVPVMLKAFQSHFLTYPDKSNIFDQVVPLFEVGRSVYSYLEEIVAMIIQNQQAQWNLEGNFNRKFFITTIALKNNIKTQVIFKQWPTIISDVINQAGSMIIPYANDCAEILLKRLYAESNNDYSKWSSIWMGDYQKALLSQDRGQVRGIVQFINPILLSINSQPTLLHDIIALSQQKQSSALYMGVIALLKCYKDIGQITIDNQNKLFMHRDAKTIKLTNNQILDLLLNVESTMTLKTLEFVTVHPKGSQPMEPLQLELALEFYKNCLKTSIPEFRKNYLAATKKMLERLRTVYEAEVTKTPQELQKNKKYKPKPYFEQFQKFLKDLIDVCYMNVFPDVIFQLANPALEILLLIGQFFNRNRYEIKKGQFFEAAHILNSTNYFKDRNFDNLLCCLQSSYESIRLLAHQILQFFYDLDDTSKLRYLWSQSLLNANKLTIKSYQYACRILAFISQVYPKAIDLPKKYSLDQFNICELFLSTIRERYEIFRKQFATQQQDYYQNLIHGMLTVFSYTLDHLASQLRSAPEKFIPYFEEFRILLNQFFGLLNQIVLFSVEVCSSNVSTVVLDTLPQSQTDKKYKVDCRGHFLEQTSVGKSVGGLIQSSALLASMENQEEGIENTLIVSFYVLTRQAGLVFQSIGNITATPFSQRYLPVESLISLVNSYFYALINLKHMGSVDRIAGGLGKMARLIFENEDLRLSQLPEKLLQKLITNLRDGKFTNILRRSAGVPYAFTCLLKSEALKRKQMIEKTIQTLLELSKNTDNTDIELRIHSLNILKKLFQDGDLKGDLDIYVSSAFISSIKGFTSEEWGVRNSSLMLFTVLSNRTVGIKPTYNLLQFFHRCPQLLDFFTEQLQHQQVNTMYPPLYPIVLLFSRLLPFDVGEKVRLAHKGQMNLKQIRKDKLLLLLPLIQKAGLNSNHMGRVMAAKAILPFMDIDGIIPYCLNLLQSLDTINQNNLVHYRLAAAYNLLLSLQQLKQQQKYHQKLSNTTIDQIVLTLTKLSKRISNKQSAVGLQLLLKTINHLLEHYRPFFNQNNQYQDLLQLLRTQTEKIIKDYFNYPDLIAPMNMGNSMAIKQCLHLHLDLLYKYQLHPEPTLITQNYSSFLLLLSQRLESNSSYLKTADTEIVEQYLKLIISFLDSYPNNKPLQQQIKHLIHQIDMQQINSDNILIQLIELRTLLKVQPQPQIDNLLQKLEQQTKNHFLQIAIFKYLQTNNPQHPLLLRLLYKYSEPDQLEELRECCVQYFQECKLEQPEHYVAYIRLLEDEQYQIRSQAAKRLAKLLNLPQLNDEVLKKHILHKLSLKQFQQWLREATDYQTKRKNHQQERIFSYDKPNKYRSDISNFMQCLQHNQNLRANPQQLSKIMERIFEFHSLDYKQQSSCIIQYQQDIINRNEYQFETILRIFLLRQKNHQAQITNIFKNHPLLQSIYPIYAPQ